MSKEFFGVQEMKEFAEASEDPRVKAMWRALCSSKSKNALWCDNNSKMREAVRKMLEGAYTEDGYVNIKCDREDYIEVNRLLRDPIQRRGG